MKLHPLAGVREAGRRAIAVGSSVFFFYGVAAAALHVGDVGLVLVLAPVGAVIGAAYGAVYHLRFRYALEDGALSIQSGLLSRTDRAIPLRRIQNVDLRQSLLQRLLGLAVVRVETAGGGETEAVLDFVSKPEAERLQRAIGGRQGAATAAPDTPAAAEPVFALDGGELAVYGLTAFRPTSLLFLLFAIPVGWGTASAILLRVAAPLGGPTSLDPGALASAAGLVLALVGAVLALAGIWAVSFLLTVVGYHGFRLGRAGDDLVYERGLLRRYSGSIPLAKVQTLTLVEHVLARRLGYAGLRVETAGYAPGGRRRAGTDRPDSAVPLARRDRALSLARSIEGFATLDPLDLERPPPVARRRYAVRYALAVLSLTGLAYAASVVLGGLAYWPAPLALLALAPVAAHCKWANRGVHVGAQHVTIRDGFWRRRTRIVPYARLQTVERRASVFQRRLGLASVLADTADSATRFGTDAVAHDLAAGPADRLAGDLRARLRATVGE